MSTSAPPDRLSLDVTTSDGATEIFVLDGQFRVVERGLGTLHADLEPGIYKVKVRTGYATEEKLVSLHDRPRAIRFDKLPFHSPAPLAATTATGDAQMTHAEQESARFHENSDRPGKGSSLFVFVRECATPVRTDATSPETSDPSRTGTTPDNPATGLTLWDLDGNLVSDLAPNAAKDPGPSTWAACHVELDPKPYLLRLDLPSGETVEQMVVTLKDWQSQIFLTLRSFSKASLRRADLATASHLFAPFAPAAPTAFDSDGPGFRLTELARLGLMNRRQVLSPSAIGEMLDGKFDNPMLGIYAAHTLLLTNPLDDSAFAAYVRDRRRLESAAQGLGDAVARFTKNPADAQALQSAADSAAPVGPAVEVLRAFAEGVREFKTFGTVVKNLRHLVGKGAHPDVEALAAYYRFTVERLLRHVDRAAAPEVDALAGLLDPVDAPYVFGHPPMLRRSWALVVGLSARKPELVPPDSLSGQVARNIWGSEPWLLWKRENQPGAAGGYGGSAVPFSIEQPQSPPADPLEATLALHLKRRSASSRHAGSPAGATGIGPSFAAPYAGGLGFESFDPGLGGVAFGMAPQPPPGAEDDEMMLELVQSTGLPRSNLEPLIERVSLSGGFEMATPTEPAAAIDLGAALTGFARFMGSVFSRKADQLVWRRLDDARVVDAAGAPSKGEDVAKNEAYFVLRLKEMYVRTARQLWQTFYPMLHSFTEHQKETEESVVGPSQLGALANAGLDRIVAQNQRLAGPTPYRGDDVNLVVGLYAVPGSDVARAFIDTVGEITKLGGITLGVVPQIADALKTGIDKTLALNATKLQLGVKDSFPAGTPLHTGIYVGIASAGGDGLFDQLWFSGGRLRTGSDKGPPFDQSDFMVIALERLDTRDDWPRLPGLAEIQAKMSSILSDGSLSIDDRKKKLSDVWPTFTGLLFSSPHLTKPDRARIANDVAESIHEQLAPAPLFAPPAPGAQSALAMPESARPSFDFARIAPATNMDQPGWLEKAEAVFSGNPFEAAKDSGK
ncbi:MAG: hypothetical protein ACHRXM_10335 [Isosphaerales bacterium]